VFIGETPMLNSMIAKIIPKSIKYDIIQDLILNLYKAILSGNPIITTSNSHNYLANCIKSIISYHRPLVALRSYLREYLSIKDIDDLRNMDLNYQISWINPNEFMFIYQIKFEDNGCWVIQFGSDSVMFEDRTPRYFAIKEYSSSYEDFGKDFRKFIDSRKKY
jgi:hypothetical protein